eukprot:351054-Chlamydomonas_euryale.AAC.4
MMRDGVGQVRVCVSDAWAGRSQQACGLERDVSVVWGALTASTLAHALAHAPALASTVAFLVWVLPALRWHSWMLARGGGGGGGGDGGGDGGSGGRSPC